MLVVGVMPVVFQCGAYLCGRDFSVGRGEGKDLVAAMLDSACLMGVDMTRSGAQDPLERPQQRTDDRGVGLCPADQEMHIRFRRVTGDADHRRRTLAVRVFTVADTLL